MPSPVWRSSGQRSNTPTLETTGCFNLMGWKRIGARPKRSVRWGTLIGSSLGFSRASRALEDSGEEFTVEVRGAFDDVLDISAVPTPFTPACNGHPPAVDCRADRCLG